ncbi:MAG: FemAB family PEP-CTERM system-associated protein [Planctomycetes bacterium]|nr:FemAB family PEP-CTERM system-associated protein [Planctomycetota bacterium]
MSGTLLAHRLTVCTHTGDRLARNYARLAVYLRQRGAVALSRHPAWLTVLRDGLGHIPYCLEAVEGGRTCGVLPLAFVRGCLFGRFLVSLPYLNSAGVVADGLPAARSLIAEAVRLADCLRVRYLELRHERVVDDPSFTDHVNGKVHMRLPLPSTAGKLWDGFDAKVRNQVRKGQKNGLSAQWGGEELLPEFYDVFSHNMRDLGTPVYGRELFRSVLRQFAGQAELCVVRAGGAAARAGRAAATGLLLHGQGVTEVPSASSLNEFNRTNANMLLYWNLLQRAVERGQSLFDFGRSTPEGGTFHFKKQWGALPEPAEWQYYCRSGHVSDVRPDNPRFRRLIRLWQKLPISLTRLLGPAIVRGLP